MTVRAQAAEPLPGPSKVTIGGIPIAYEVLGSGPTVMITPGGRYPMSSAGVRELAEGLTESGLSAVIWDRPNCGHSGISFDADSESALWADAAAGLIRELGLGPVVMLGGSAGSRVSLLTAARHPDAVRAMYLLWISGGTFGLMTLGVHYVGDCLMAATRFGMDRVAALRTWRDAVRNDPANRDRILGVDRERFIATMHSWIDHYNPPPGSPVPGMTVADFARIDIPACVLRSGTTDLHHPRETSEHVARLLPNARLDEPPWGDDEWNQRGDLVFQGNSPFVNWPALAPGVVRFLGDVDVLAQGTRL